LAVRPPPVDDADMDLDVRDERPQDHAAIRRLLIEAFGGEAEADLVEQLRAGGEAPIALVALADGGVAGHVMLSRMQAPFSALALAPLAVAGLVRRRGVGMALVRKALARARAEGWEGVFVLGDPGYYARLGFSLQDAEGFESPYAGPHFMLAAFDPSVRRRKGPLVHALPFAALG
jgi:putative acetyltransferase